MIESPDDPPEDEPKSPDHQIVRSPDPSEDLRKTPFVPLLLYVLGFMAALALLAWAVAWLLRHI